MKAPKSSPPAPVKAWSDTLTLPTYLPAAPDKNPMFLEKRVYQGSNGKVYPLPFTDRIAETAVPHAWQALWIENEYLRVLVLPELGGRIHAIQDLTNGYDLIYRQHVIKPALVGLTGPWASGGIEFNWPQHHRPATFLPVDWEIERHPDGSATLWCSDHDPMARMKGMHGVCLHPGHAYVELKVRAYNRTPLTQTFLWWANVATRAHEAYQSFFPPDVRYVADHARRSLSEYPHAKGTYYGVNYSERARSGLPADERPPQFVPPHAGGQAPVDYAPNDLSFYANIPTPCSYMCVDSQGDFVGGYDHRAEAGLVHFANHHIAPGKKQWTWGNHPFGYAWDRNLTEPDERGEYGPYIEIMAGVYTDNQPDFSFLQPGETRTWSQYWYPIRKIGPAQHANLHAAVSFRVTHRTLHLGVSVTRPLDRARILVTAHGRPVFRATRRIAPNQPFVTEIALPPKLRAPDLRLRVTDATGQPVIDYQPVPPATGPAPRPATEPPAPADVTSADELYLTGLHLNQYRHATRCPTLYWREALRRDPLDARCNHALGLWHFQRGEFDLAEAHFRRALARLTQRNANPYDGEPLYHLGLTLRHLGRDTEAYAALYKATWNQAWASASYHALAEIDATRHDWNTALDHLRRALARDVDNLRARNLQVLVLRQLGRDTEAGQQLAATRALDPLDSWARHLQGAPLTHDLQAHLDIAHDLARAGFHAEAIALLEPTLAQAGSIHSGALPTQSWGALPLVAYTLGWLELQRGNDSRARRFFRRARRLPTDYCFPARLEEIAVLRGAMQADPRDPRAPYYLGNLLYDRRRHAEALECWESARRLDPTFSVVWRNLGIGYFNIRQQPAKALAAYDRAVRTAPDDGRLLYERDQLWKRLGRSPAQRLRVLEQNLERVQGRDDLSVELGALYLQTAQPEKALALVQSRRFQPWEGGEGGPLGLWARAHLALGRRALKAGDAIQAGEHFAAALTAPPNLGEARHLLANHSDIHYWLGCARAAAGDTTGARTHWQAAATFRGDFQAMRVQAFSEMTYYSALAWERLGQRTRARRLLQQLRDYARELQHLPAKVEYFATSLPTMLLFDDDLQRRQETTALFLQAQASLGLGQRTAAKRLLAEVLRRDPHHPWAADL